MVWWMLIMRCYPGPYKYHEATSRLSQRRQSCEQSELLLETVWTPGSGVTMPPSCHHQPPHTGNLTNIWSCCESKVSLIIGSAFFLYKLFPVRWAAAGCLHGRSFSSSKLIGTLGSYLICKVQIHATFTSVWKCMWHGSNVYLSTSLTMPPWFPD